MRAVIQRVTAARVAVEGREVSVLDFSESRTCQGLLILVAVTHSDDITTAHAMASKIWRLRILDGERSAEDLAAPVMVVSQFTLYGDTTKGRRPSWNRAAPGDRAEPLVAALTERLEALGAKVAAGRFGARMDIDMRCDGPVTVLVET